MSSGLIFCESIYNKVSQQEAFSCVLLLRSNMADQMLRSQHVAAGW